MAKKARQGQSELGSITFTKVDVERVKHSHNCPLVIQLWVHNFGVKRILVDTDISVEVMYYDLFKSLKLLETDLKLARDLLVGFNS